MFSISGTLTRGSNRETVDSKSSPIPKQPTRDVKTTPSAPNLATKTTATNVQSGTNPSGMHNIKFLQTGKLTELSLFN